MKIIQLYRCIHTHILQSKFFASNEWNVVIIKTIWNGICFCDCGYDYTVLANVSAENSKIHEQTNVQARITVFFRLVLVFKFIIEIFCSRWFNDTFIFSEFSLSQLVLCFDCVCSHLRFMHTNRKNERKVFHSSVLVYEIVRKVNIYSQPTDFYFR